MDTIFEKNEHVVNRELHLRGTGVEQILFIYELWAISRWHKMRVL